MKRRRNNSQQYNQGYVRSMFFGVEDSLVSTTGLVLGVSVGAESSDFVLLAGMVAIIVEAVSMGTGEYLSDDAMNEIKRRKSSFNPVISSLLMFVSYFIAGLVPLLPAVLLPYPISILASSVASLIGLFLLGYVKGKHFGKSAFIDGSKVLIIGGIAMVIGLMAGFLLKV